MFISGISVSCRPDRYESTTSRICEIEGVDIHAEDRSTGKLAATIESRDLQAEIEIFQRIQTLPGVASAELVFHAFGDLADAPQMAGSIEPTKPTEPTEPTERRSAR